MTTFYSNLTSDMAMQAGKESAGQDLQNKISGLGALNSSKLSPEAKAKKLREACDGFESIFIQKMWQEMRKTVPQNSLMHGREEHFWQDMYDQELAKKMTSAGGIGLSDMMYEQLSRNLVSASRTTTSALSEAEVTRAFVPEPAPLIAPNPKNNPDLLQEPETKTEAKEQQVANNIYEEQTPPVQDNITDKQSLAQAQPVVQEAPLSNPGVARALAALHAEQAKRDATAGLQANQLAARPKQRRQTVNSLELVSQVKRQAGDQLGARGVREPLLPQTKKAQARTERARQLRDKMVDSADVAFYTPTPAPNTENTTESSAQPANESVTRVVRYTTNIPQKGQKNVRRLQRSVSKQQQEDSIRTLNVAANTPQNVQNAPLQPLTAKDVQGTNEQKTSENTSAVMSFSPLTVNDLKS